MSRRNFDELRAQLKARIPDYERRADEWRRIYANEAAQYAQTLAQIRRAHALTQVEVARRLGVSQAQVSRVENQTDLYLSTREGYLSAVGAEIEIVACFPDGTRIPLSLAELTHSEADSEQAEYSPGG